MSQTIVGTGKKDPDDRCPFTVDWEDWLAVTEDTIVDCDVFADGMTVYDCWFTITDTTAKVGGGSDGSKYLLTFRIYTASGDVYDRSIYINVGNR